MAQRMHADEFDIDVGLVRRLVAGRFPEWRHLPIAPVPSAGTDHAMFRLGSDLAVRLPRIEAAVGQARREQRWLPTLAPWLPVPVSSPIHVAPPAEGYPWPWSVVPWLAGVNPDVDDLVEPQGLADDLARFVRALHSIDPTAGPRSTRGGPLAARDEPTRAALAALEGLVDTAAATDAWERALRTPPWTGESVWLHADLSPGNVLVLEGRLSAVLDFGVMGVGDPASDLIPAWNLLPAVVRRRFREALEVDDDTWARGRGRALSIALIQLPYYRHTNPALAANSRHVIAEVLADDPRDTRP